MFPQLSSQFSSLFPSTHSPLFSLPSSFKLRFFPSLNIFLVSWCFRLFSPMLWSIPLPPLSVSLFLSLHSLLYFVLFPYSCSLIHFILFMITVSVAISWVSVCAWETLSLSLPFTLSLCIFQVISLLSVLWCTLSACFLSRHCSVWGGVRACTSLFHFFPLLISMPHPRLPVFVSGGVDVYAWVYLCRCFMCLYNFFLPFLKIVVKVYITINLIKIYGTNLPS